MRVLFVAHNFPRTPGDLPGNFLLRLARALQADAIDVRVVAPHARDLPHRHTVDGVEVIRFRYASDARETLAYSGTMAAQVRGSMRAKYDLATLVRRAAREIGGADADIVHAHWWFPSGLAANARVLRGRPLVTTMHGRDVRLARSAPARVLMRRVLARSTRVTAVSSWLADEAVRLAGTPRPAVAPMPVDVDLFVPGTATRDGLLFVGKLDAQKGAAVAIDALALLPAPIVLTVAGDGPDAARLRVRAAERGVAHRVRWRGALPQHELPALYQAAQLLVVPATAPEGLGLTAVEALLCETPVVASNTGGLTDVVAEGETGRLVPPGDATALAAAIADALANAPRLAAWGREGRARMRQRFDPAACARVYRAVYEDALGATTR